MKGTEIRWPKESREEKEIGERSSNKKKKREREKGTDRKVREGTQVKENKK